MALLAVLSFCGAESVSQNAESAGASAVRERLTALLAKLPKKAQLGLMVADAATGQTWFAREADTPLKPASVQKLFITAAALERFGPGFEYQTRVYTHGDELWVVGAGDPAIGDERIAQRHKLDRNHVFDEWAAALKARGVTTLSRIVLDDGVFDRQTRHPDWPDDQADRWYQAPVGGLNVNDNCLDVEVVVRNRKLELRLQPDLPSELIRSTLALGKRQAPLVKRPADSDVFQLRGTIARSATLDPASCGDPTTFFGHALTQALERRGIQVRGGFVRRTADMPAPGASAPTTTPPSALATHTTALADVLWRCNTFSQNLFAECLMKSLAAYEPDGRRSGTPGSGDGARGGTPGSGDGGRSGGTPGSWAGGEAVVRATLAKLGVDLSGAELRDGSGLSHADRATAAQLTRLLIVMRRHRCADEFVGSLAEPGEEGSMNHRYDDPALRGRLRGKTGTLQGVHALAGYLTRPDGTVLAFALLINGPPSTDLPKQVCKALVGP
jgi:D-alanyl-D-alanine carboxypeptidase/D-alanyl-D-alanine-endopeptidase (penicillin-binding protein 4)